MNEKEALKDLLKTPKPYTHPEMSQAVFSNYIVRFKAGILKPATFREFMLKFGYRWDGEKFQKDFEFVEYYKMLKSQQCKEK